jgi:hypothetical protein
MPSMSIRLETQLGISRGLRSASALQLAMTASGGQSDVIAREGTFRLRAGIFMVKSVQRGIIRLVYGL